jgi:hypothetical protein
MVEPTIRPVELPDPGVPADHGLSSLGLLMQLGGNVFAALAALLAFTWLLEAADETPRLVIVFGLSIARSMVHRAAGVQLLYGEGETGRGDRLAGIRRYVRLALAHTIAMALLAAQHGAAIEQVLALAAGLAAWPLVLGVIITRPRFARYRAGLPISEDKGFEGASILMAVLGACGLFLTVGWLVVVRQHPDRLLESGPGVVVVLAGVMLAVRAVTHLRAGLAGLRHTSVDHAVERANRYANFGVITAFCAGGALMVRAMSSEFDLRVLAAVCTLVWTLLTWPLIVRRFFADRQFADLLAGDEAPLHRRSPDAGLTSLGWLLVAGATILLAASLWAVADGFEVPGGTRSMWWPVGVAVLEGWAGVELVQGSRVARAVATACSIVALAVSVYVLWPVVEDLHRLDLGPAIWLLSPLALGLILPIATLLLVRRDLSPSARARFRPRQPR